MRSDSIIQIPPWKTSFVFWVFFWALLCSPQLSAQTAIKLEALLGKASITWSEAAAFVLEASEAAVYKDPAEAFKFAAEQKWLPENAAPGDPARFDGIALLLMGAFDLKGGIFYRITQSPHRAYREMVYKKIIRENSDPHALVSGAEFLLMLNRLFSMQESAAQPGGQ